MANEEALRIQALSMYMEGIPVTSIAMELGRSRQWVHKWIKRHESESETWNISKSNAPHSHPNKISIEIEEQIIATRQELMNSPYFETGAHAIWHKLNDAGVTPPSVSSINRILNRHKLSKRKIRYQKSNLEYPKLPLDVQIMDLIGPRYIHGGERYYILTIISNDTRHAGVFPILSKSGSDITQSIVNFWKEYRVPSFLQMDNELSFRGSNRHPRGLGILLRTAMQFNVVPIFIPIGEPWRNGVIERFNQKVSKTLLVQKHNSFEDLLLHASEFVSIHNKYHHYSTMKQKSPLELDMLLDLSNQSIPSCYQVTERPIIDKNNRNEIRFIRLVRSNLIINVLNTDIKVKQELMHTYVEAHLLINEHKLLIKLDNKTVQEMDFKMPLI